MTIAEVREDAIDVIKDHLSVLAAGHPIHELGDTFEVLSAHFQTLGCCNLLLSADPDGFAKNLLLSAFGRRFYLRKCAENRAHGPLHLAISRTDSFLAALTAGRRDVAVELVDLSSQDWIEDGEYEDDFCYRAFLHSFVRDHPDLTRAPMETLLSRFESVLEGAESVRLDLCRTLLAGDADSFHQAFGVLVDGREAGLAAEVSTDGPPVLPQVAVFVEGLALLELARWCEFELEVEYAGCPTLARNLGKAPLPDDLFQELEEQFEL